eukprot:m51a1_g7685 hypothetical protein (724) ;mRNA; f:25398-30663
MKNAAIASLLSIACACAAFDLEFVGNVSGVEADSNLQFRTAGLFAFNGPMQVFCGAIAYSLDTRVADRVLANQNVANIAADAQGIWAYGGVSADTLPSAWFGVFNASATVGVGLNALADVNVHGALGFMGMVFTSLVERDQGGAVVHTQSLIDSALKGGLWWTQTGYGPSEKAPGAHYYRITGNRLPLTVSITFIISSVSGVVDYGMTTVVPKVLETVIEIEDYPYKNPKNTLEVHMVAGSAGLQVGAHAAVTTSGVKVFADVKGTAIVNGNEANAEVSAWANVDAKVLENSVLANLIAGATGVVSVNNIKCAEVAVKFEAGAQAIVYDPALGTGTSPYELATNGQASRDTLAWLEAGAETVETARRGGEAAPVGGAAFDLSFVGNISGVSADVDLQFRSAGLVVFNLPAVHHGAIAYSLDASVAAAVLDPNRDIAKVSADVQGIWAYGGATVLTPPAAWFGIFNASARVGVGLSAIGDVNVHGALGFMGLTYTSLVERNQSGAIVSRQSLVDNAISGMSWTDNGYGPAKNAQGAYYYRLVGTKKSLTVSITFIISSVSGVLDYGKTTVVPKVLESVIEINNYPYQDSKNTLEVHMVAGSAGLQVGAHAAVTTSGVKVFADVKGTAIVNGNEANAEVSAWANVDAKVLENSVLANLIAGATGVVSVNNIKCAEVAVKFEAGAQAIVYDPALGTGTSPYELSPASAAAPAALVAFAALLMALFH